jgi:Zn-dependent protease with chaperone function
MTEKRFEQLVRELEGHAKSHPSQYKLKVALLAVAGYAYVLAVLATVISLTIGCFMLMKNSSGAHVLLFKVGLGLIILATVIVRALWVRLEPPTGIEIQREHAPRLFLLIDKIRNALGTPAFHHVLIVNDLNAAVVQVPRIGIFGWQRNYLLLGLPLMLTFTPAQFRAVLAHEFGHLGRQHGRFSSWIYRARVTWWRLLQEMTARQHWASFVFTKFLAWYAPFFNAYSFVMAREQEYEADRNAAHLVGPHCMKDTLASLAVVGRVLRESFWPSLDQRNRETATPPDTYLHDLASTIQMPAHRKQAQAFYGEAMHIKTGYADTHPSLADRLAALNTVPAKKTAPTSSTSIPQLLEAGNESAGQYYLGQRCDELRDQLNREWAEQVKGTWKQTHEEKQEAQARVLELREKSACGELTEEELWDYAMKAELLEGEKAAVPLLRQLVDRSPNHAGGNFALGRLLLSQGDRAGLEHLERAVAKDQDAFLTAAELAEAFFTRKGQLEEAETYRRRAMERRDLMNEAEKEWRLVLPDDAFLAHGLPGDTIRQIVTDLSGVLEIGKAYLVRKQVQVMPELPAYVLIVVPKYPWYEWREDAKNEALLARLSQEVALPPSSHILVLGSRVKRRWQKKALCRIAALPLKPLAHKDAGLRTRTVSVQTSSTGSAWLYWARRRWVEGAVGVSVIALLAIFSAHPEPNCSPQISGTTAKPPTSGTLYFVPIGEFPATQYAAVTAHYASAWHLPVRRLPPLPLDDSLWDRTRNQLAAERVIAKMQREYAGPAADPGAILIGLTAQDMYREQSSWRYAFSHRDGGRYAVVSSARMHPQSLPLHLPHGSLFAWDLRDDELALCRLTKMVGKNIGVLYYRLPMNDDPTSLLYNNIGGPNDLDRIIERF